MSGAGWKDIWTLIEKLVAEQPPFIQIAIGLGAAFSVLMFVEGLRANFFVRRPRPISTAQGTPPSSSSRSAALPTSATTSAYRSVRASAGFVPRALPRAVKCRANAVSRHRALRPKISVPNRWPIGQRRHSPSTLPRPVPLRRWRAKLRVIRARKVCPRSRPSKAEAVFNGFRLAPAHPIRYRVRCCDCRT